MLCHLRLTLLHINKQHVSRTWLLSAEHELSENADVLQLKLVPPAIKHEVGTLLAHNNAETRQNTA